MDDVAAMRKRETFGGLRDDVKCRIDRQRRASPQQVFQFAAVNEFHGHVRHVVGFANVVNGDDIRVIKAPGRFYFLFEARFVLHHFLGRQHEVDGFYRDHAIDVRIDCLIDDAHRATTDNAEYLVAAEDL